MSKTSKRKAKTININLTEKEYEKVKHFAELRNMNPTSYARLVALGNRIKPTVIEKTYSSRDVVQQLKQDNNELKMDIEALQSENNDLKRKISYSKEGQPSTM
ncbi:plasmid mobilization protein [Staphylococcus epidermidis]|uniref:plasmid mobilization protein n=1 Tax=Staphylococcus epidermidis TaxID=1282 RepID=UPI00241DD0FD|nr:hypothetical protein [Staphylococcus epidermidis]